MIQRDLLNCNTYIAKCLFLLLKASDFGIKTHSKLCFFETPSWRPFFVIRCWFYAKNIDLGTPAKSSGRPNRPPNSPSGAKHFCFWTLWKCLFSVLFSWCICSSFGSLLVFFWYPFGSNWLSSPSLWYYFHCFSVLLAPTFKPNAGMTSFWLFVSVRSAWFQGCQCRYVLNTSNSTYVYML